MTVDLDWFSILSASSAVRYLLNPVVIRKKSLQLLITIFSQILHLRQNLYTCLNGVRTLPCLEFIRDSGCDDG